MTIQTTFRYGGDLVSVIVDKNNLLFVDSSGNTTTIQGLKLNHSGVIEEHPDLKDDDNWRKKAIERLKNHIQNIQTEMEKIKYVKEELTKFGYEALYYQRNGFRPTKWK